MAQLPPKAPNMSTNWPDMSYCISSGINADDQSAWMDNFQSFSSGKQGTHRRSISDSAAFLEPVAMSGESRGNEFEFFYDEPLMSIFDDMPPLSSALVVPMSSSSTSNEEKFEEKQLKIESQEAQSRCNLETFAAPQQSVPALDQKRVKRILANRQSAQKSRVRKMHYVTELERSVTSLQNEVSTLSPQVAYLDHQRSLLTVGNGQLKQRIAALAQDKIFKDAHQEALKKEIERLRQIYHHQTLKSFDSQLPEINENVR